MGEYKKKQWPKWDEFIRENKPGVAVIYCSRSIQAGKIIRGFVYSLGQHYHVECIDMLQYKTPADIEMIIHKRDAFVIGKQNIKPKMLVFENIETIKPDSLTSKYISELITKYSQANQQKQPQYMFLIVDKEIIDWNKWLGYIDKLPNVPKFRIFPPNKEEKINAMESLKPFALTYQPQSQPSSSTSTSPLSLSSLPPHSSIRQKMEQLSGSLHTYQDVQTFEQNVFAFGQVYQIDKEKRDDCNLFEGINYLRNKCRIQSTSDWKHVENIIKQHSDGGGIMGTDKDILRKLVNLNPPEINMGCKKFTHSFRSKWYNEFSELDSLGYDGLKLIPVTIGLTSWSEKFKSFKYLLEKELTQEDNNSIPFRTTKLKSTFDNYSYLNNIKTCNEYLSNQFTPFEIFDNMSLMRNVSFMFDYYCKIIHEIKDINLLVDRLMKQFGIVMELGPRQSRIYRPELMMHQEEINETKNEVSKSKKQEKPKKKRKQKETTETTSPQKRKSKKRES